MPLADVCLVLLIIFVVVTPMIVDRVEPPRTLRPDDEKPDRAKQIKLVEAGFHSFGLVVQRAPAP